MLRDLHVENLAVVSSVSVSFEAGLNALTGETGAGKSIVVDAMALLSGARASSGSIRSGTDTLLVTGVFEPAGDRWRAVLGDAGIESECRELVIRREINREGRNRVFLNDRPVSAGLIAEVAQHLIQIHTQREELGLVSTEMQRIWLDESGGQEGRKLRDRVASLFDVFDHLSQRLERARGDDRARIERADLLRFQIGEIDAASCEADEDLRLDEERAILRHAEAIHQALTQAHSRVFEADGSAIELVSLSTRLLRDVDEWETRATEWAERLIRARVELEEVAAEMRSRVDQVAADPRRLDQIEERLALIDRLRRKYGSSVREILEYRESISHELEELETDVEQQDRLESRVSEAFEEYRAAALELSAARQAWARKLAQRVESELSELAMARARFEVRLDTTKSSRSRLEIQGTPCAFGREGFDRVEFCLAANQGEEMAPLARSASGGELSRIYLAVQLAARGAGPAAKPTLVFDEVDAGVGGAEAAALGDKLARLAAGGQILVVTHLPQVASNAEVHYRVRKSEAEGRTVTTVSRLDDQERVEEVARMLGGRELTSLSISHAEEMIDTGGRREI